MQGFVAKASPWRLVLLVAGAIAFVAMGFWLAGLAGPSPKPGGEWIGWACILFFGFCGIVGFRRIFDLGDQVRISGSGIYFRQWSEQTIPWSEITDISVWKFQGQKSLILHLAHPDRYQSTTILGKMAATNRALTGGDVAISLTGTDRSFADALAAAQYFRNAA